MHFEPKQSRVILTWYKLGIDNEDKDYYMSFISYWISFNAICYNLYHKECISERANIDTKKSKMKDLRKKLRNIDNLKSDTTTLKLKEDDKLTVDIQSSSRLFFSIERKYTEDLIYNKFVNDYTEWYDVADKKEQYNRIKRSLEKYDRKNDQSRFYIKNMARIDDFERLRSRSTLEELNNKNIIILCEDNSLNIIKRVFYQIRCNIFHGEKVPGDLNDDRIAEGALPMLKLLVEKLIEDHRIEDY